VVQERRLNRECSETTMTPGEREILTVLEQLQSAVAQMRTANPKPDLRPIFTKLDELTHALPKGTDKLLLHFLHNKSYEKAQQWLQAQS
jgi:hypothetical protein